MYLLLGRQVSHCRLVLWLEVCYQDRVGRPERSERAAPEGLEHPLEMPYRRTILLCSLCVIIDRFVSLGVK